MKEKDIIHFRLEVSTEIWTKFKTHLTKSKTINQAIIDLINEFIEKNKVT